jgi:hypothetical protein
MKHLIKPTLLTLLFMHLLALAYAQTPTNAARESDNRYELKYDRGISTEMNYQGKYGFALGGMIGNNIGHRIKSNYSMGIYTDLILADSLIFGPRLKLNWNHLNFFGFGVNFSNHYRSGVNDFRITPEINFSLNGLANLFFGYSIPVGDTKFAELSEFRVGLNVNLVGRN